MPVVPPVRDSSRFLDRTLETCGRTLRTRGRWLAAPRLYGLRLARPAGRCGPQDGLRVLMGRPAGRNGWDSMRTRPGPAAGNYRAATTAGARERYVMVGQPDAFFVSL